VIHFRTEELRHTCRGLYTKWLRFRDDRIRLVQGTKAMSICLDLGSGGIRMCKSECSEKDRAQLGNPSMSGSADHTGC
jgi:hypothetical protein